MIPHTVSRPTRSTITIDTIKMFPSIHGHVDRRSMTTSPFPVKLMTFAGGEPHCQLDDRSLEGPLKLSDYERDPLADQSVLVTARIADADGFMQLLAVLDAVRAQSPKWLGLAIPYFPGARQDHPERGTPFTARIYADAIMRVGNPDRVLVVDPHSNVVRALIGDRLDWITPENLMPQDLSNVLYQGVIAPDAGAVKRAAAVAEWLDVSVVHATKRRDPRNGKLLDTYVPDLLPGRWLVVDDICDGGGTFIRLADAVMKANESRHPDERANLDLWVTHGIFSKGIAPIAKPWFDRIITTDSLPLRDTHVQLHVVSLRTAIEKWAISRVPLPLNL